MKKTLFLIITVLLSQNIIAQDLSAFRSDKLQEVSMYFIMAKSFDEKLNIIAKPEMYNRLTIQKKANLLGNLSSEYTKSSFIVRSGNICELWYKESSAGTLRLVDSWDMANPDLKRFAPVTMERASKHPWFFNFSGQAHINEDETGNMSFQTRIGFFMLRDTWDLALSYNLGILQKEVEYTTYSDINLNSRVYYPIRKYKLSPYLGAGVAYNISTIHTEEDESIKTTTFSIPVSFGVSWLLGPGSVEVGGQYNKSRGFSATIGYTFRPDMLIRRAK
ncbi:MAG: porin family protein [Bacteroidales bacterium]|nr:porin family protein [Bacteroidales bacterium]